MTSLLKRSIVIPIFWVFFLTACNNVLSGWSSAPAGWWSGGTPSDVRTVEASSSQATSRAAVLLSRETTPHVSPTPTHRRAVTHTTSAENTSTPTVTRVPPTKTATPLPGSTPTENLIASSAPFQICSPLQVVERKDLPRVTSDGYRPPPKGSDERHPAVDFAYYHWKGYGRIEGSQVHAVLPGKVTAALDDTYPFGSVVIIETEYSSLPADLRKSLGIPDDQSLYLLYAHMQDGSLKVHLGEGVEPCQTIGLVGYTGNAGAAHLHFENRYGPPGASFSSFSAYLKTADREARANYRLWSTSGEFQHFDPMRLLLYGVTGAFTPTPTPLPPNHE
jgi:murein DD-endopeptidase MepM/ murein hydrolase activator NlpD